MLGREGQHVDETLLELAGRGLRLEDAEAAAMLVDDEIGERATDIDASAIAQGPLPPRAA
jgi:hypothetical protein